MKWMILGSVLVAVGFMGSMMAIELDGEKLVALAFFGVMVIGSVLTGAGIYQNEKKLASLRAYIEERQAVLDSLKKEAGSGSREK